MTPRAPVGVRLSVSESGRRLGHTLTLACLIALSLVAGNASSAQPPPRLMPKYKIVGDPVIDPAVLAQERKQFDAAFELFKQAASEYQKEVKEFIGRDIGTKQRSLANTYQTQIDKLEQEQFDLRRDAIARLEGFIFRHRDHNVYTPDSMFRLAELYYEDTIGAYNRASDNFARELDLYNRGKLLDPPNDAKRDFSRSIAIYKYLHWVPPGTTMDPLSGKLAGVILEPNDSWRKREGVSDAAMYLQGFCEYEMRELDPKMENKAVVTLAALEDHYPKSKYVAEAWLRVGEINFDNNEYDKAATAYERAAIKAKELGDNGNYSLALYKLGWSNFQLYKYSEAVKWFQQLIEFEDELKLSIKADEKDKKKSGFDLRKEAIEYLAKSLAEPSWDDDNCDDFGSTTTKGECPIVDPRARPILYTASILEPKLPPEQANWQTPFKGDVLANMQKNFQARNDVRASLINGKPYVFDILLTYGLTLFNQREDDYYWQAIRVMGYVIDNYPMVREAQDLQRKIISSVDILASFAASFEAEIKTGKGGRDAQIGLDMANEAKARQIVERQRYMKQFGKGSEWYKKYGSDKDLSAQVDDQTSRIRREFAMLSHAEAQRLKGEGKIDEAIAKYAEAASAYEDLLNSDRDAPDAYKLAWTLAEIWYFAGVQCNAPRDKDRNLIMVDEEVVPWPAEKQPVIKKACEAMQKSIAYYNMVRDWKGSHTKDEETGKPMEKTEEAAFSAVGAAEQVLAARAAYDKADPERVGTLSLPEIRPSNAKDQETIKANENEKDIKRVTRVPIDPLAVEWILAADGYVANADKFLSKEDPERAPKLALKAAELLYKNRHFDPWKEGATPRTSAEFWSARKRFEAILNRFRGSKQASEAVKNLLTGYWLENDIDALTAVTEKFGDQVPKEDKTVIDRTVKFIKFGALSDRAFANFKAAEADEKSAAGMPNPDDAGKLLAVARKRYTLAADDFRKVRQEVMGVEKMKEAERIKTSRVVLLNSVRAYHRAELWDKCVDTLKEAEQMLREWSPTDTGEKKERTDALQEVLEIRANLNFDFFKIEEAISDFVLLYQNDINGKKADYYLKTAAQMAFFNSNWEKAIQLNKEVIARFEKSPEQAKQLVVKDAVWQLYIIEKSRASIPKQIETLEAFIARYQTDKPSSGKVFKAYGIIAEIHETKGDKAAANKMYARIIEAFIKGGYEKNGGPEASAAAQSTFQLLRPRFDDFMTTKLVENAKLPKAKRMPDLQNQVKKMMEVLLGPEIKFKAPDGSQAAARCGDCPLGNKLCRDSVCVADVTKNGLYDEYLSAVSNYGSQNWSYAAFLYRARLLKYFARQIYDAPRPADLSEDEVTVYEEFLEKLGAVFENRAIQSLKLALNDAEGKGVVNQWVTELRSEMNKYRPKEYPLLRDEKRAFASPIGTLPQVEKELR